MKYIRPVKARPVAHADAAWFYKERGRIYVVISINGGVSRACTIRKSQLAKWMKEKR